MNRSINKHYLLDITILIVSFAAAFLLSAVVGCSFNSKSVPFHSIDNRRTELGQYGRIDIPQEELAEGLTSVFQQMSQKLGPIDYEPLVKDYVPLVHQGLCRSGYSSIRRLNVNGTTVDIDIYFRIKDPPPSLNIEVYLDGQLAPSFSLVNQYYVTSE